MSKYKPGDDVGPLEPWPLDAPQSDYVIAKGAPKTYGRIDAGGPGHTTRYGIWHCTKGALTCTEQGVCCSQSCLESVGSSSMTPGRRLTLGRATACSCGMANG